jgi:prepilin-type N-terminal cleavage/methylation domain-containing protein
MTRVLSSRKAFTLMELLVVIAIIVVLIFLLLPAVQRVRESANRVSCASNLHQIGLAFHTHADTFHYFPTGGNGYTVARTLSGGVPASYASQRWAWGYQLLPYVEQSNLYNDPSDEVVSGTPLRLYFCPSRRPPAALSGGPWAVHDYPRAMTDYAGNAGTTDRWGDGGGNYGDGSDGLVIRLGSSAFIGPGDVPDGASNTLLVGEKHMNVAFVTTECQPDDNDGYVGGFQDDVVRWGAFPPARDGRYPAYTPATEHPHIWQFGSSHPAGFQAVFADGAVHLIRFEIDPTVFRYVCSRNDGQVLDLSGL